MKRQEGLIHRFIADCRNGKYKMINPIYDFVPCRSGECKGKVFRAISKDKKYYWACNLCDAAYADDDGKCGKMFGGRPPEDAPKLPCPSCKKNVFQVERESQSSGKKYKCWVCPDCKSSYFDSNGGIGQPFGKPPAKKTSNGQKSGQKASAT